MSEEYNGKENKVNIEEKVSHYAFNDKKNTFEPIDDSSVIDKGSGQLLAVSDKAKLYVVLGWISAALTFFISPLFAIAGITFGILLNRQKKDSGNILIIANVVIGSINLILGMIYLLLAERMIGY